jgi:hypothetical protein
VNHVGESTTNARLLTGARRKLGRSAPTLLVRRIRFHRDLLLHGGNHRCARVRTVVPPRLSRPERTGPKWDARRRHVRCQQNEFQSGRSARPNLAAPGRKSTPSLAGDQLDNGPCKVSAGTPCGSQATQPLRGPNTKKYGRQCGGKCVCSGRAATEPRFLIFVNLIHVLRADSGSTSVCKCVAC